MNKEHFYAHKLNAVRAESYKEASYSRSNKAAFFSDNVDPACQGCYVKRDSDMVCDFVFEVDDTFGQNKAEVALTIGSIILNTSKFVKVGNYKITFPEINNPIPIAALYRSDITIHTNFECKIYATRVFLCDPVRKDLLEGEWLFGKDAMFACGRGTCEAQYNVVIKDINEVDKAQYARGLYVLRKFY